MPEYRVEVKWPDGRRDEIYSPSSVVLEYFRAGYQFSVPQFAVRSGDALSAASDRVRRLYGSPCGRALSEIRRLESIVERLERDGLGEHPVEILAVEPLESRSCNRSTP